MTNVSTLALKKADGSPLSRIEAESELWTKCKTSHAMRLLAANQFGLDSRYVWRLKPTSVTHWLLDEMVRKRLIAGDQIGVQPDLESDDSYFNAYIQRLGAFVQDGRALMPKEGEGINMTDFNHQMPPPPNGQPQQSGYAPPPPPPMGGFPQQQQPPQFQGAPQQSYGAPPPPAPQAGFGAPPQPSFGPPPQFNTMPPQQGGAPSFPPQGPPPPISQPPQQAGPPGAPPAPPAQAPSNRRGRGKAAEAGPPPAAGGFPQPSATPMPFPNGAPAQGGFAPPGAPPQQFGAPPTQAGPGIEAAMAQIAALQGIVSQQAQQIADLVTLVKGIDAGVSILVRPCYNRQFPNDASQLGIRATFAEIGLPYPS
jgi:hypothetical protein